MLDSISITFITCFIFLFVSFFTEISANARCTKVVGRVHCQTDWDRHFNVNIWLMDRDPLPWETDDYMAQATSDEDGNFKIEGCAEDLGSWNSPDPYLVIEHRCPEPGHTVSIPRRRKIVLLEPVYTPETIYIGSIRLDEDDE
ncbi:Transthyretin-like family-containing protein [Aphelenchoides bicaudatus]|nr:Transthyretin-like family-containing protein [Aphelenchoides bicaudatus]